MTLPSAQSGTSRLHSSALSTLTSWQPATPGQAALAQAFVAFLEATGDACRRSCDAGHLTASALVMTSDGARVCLVHHKIVQAWLQPGGHLEETDESLPEAALREAREETGLDGLQVDPTPIHLDCHPITCRGRTSPTRHLDVRFLVTVPADQAPVVSDESSDVRWFDVDDLPEVFDEVRELIGQGQAHLAHVG